MRTEANHDVPIFLVRVAFIVELHGVLVEKDLLGLFKGNAMLLLVSVVLCLIPLE